jgi:hypothetical protein
VKSQNPPNKQEQKLVKTKKYQKSTKDAECGIKYYDLKYLGIKSF